MVVLDSVARCEKRNLRAPTRVKRSGAVLISYSFIMVALLGISSLAVDLGHVELVKTQLQVAADAAAQAGAAQLVSGNGPTQIAAAIAVAIQTGALNTSDNAPVTLLSSDIVVGNWDKTKTPNFSVSRSPANAVQVNAMRAAARSNPVVLLFAPAIGVQTCNAHATSIAAVLPPISPYGIVGINHVNFASAGVLAKVVGDVASDGDISIGNPAGLLVTVTKNAQSYTGYVTHGSLATIGGSTAALSSALNFPAVAPPGHNSNSAIASYLDSQSNFIAVGLAIIPAGTYVVHDLNLLADVNMNLQGPVTFYVTGSFNIAAGVNLLGNTNTDPSNFNVEVVSGGSVNFLANILVPVTMNIYAPQSAITITVGVTSFTGELIGLTLDINLPILGSFTEVKPGYVPQVISLVD